jgi:hypothetical protein
MVIIHFTPKYSQPIPGSIPNKWFFHQNFHFAQTLLNMTIEFVQYSFLCMEIMI